MYFTLYGSNTVSQARGLTRDLKMGQYTKLPPRTTFLVQTVGTIIGCILQLIIMKSIISSKREILLDIQGTNIWSGQQVQSFNSQAITWGALATKMYGPGTPYFIIPMSIVIGLFVPVPFWIGHKFFPNAKLDRVVTPIVSSGFFTLHRIFVKILTSLTVDRCAGLLVTFRSASTRPCSPRCSSPCSRNTTSVCTVPPGSESTTTCSRLVSTVERR